MVSYENFYAGASSGLDPAYTLSHEYGESFLGMSYRVPVSSFGFPTDPRIANQMDAVSKKLNTGAKVVEVSGVTPSELESIPKQQFKEINRLKKLVGAELTFHGPIVEPTGISQEGWNEAARLQSERQMFNAVERAQQLEPDGNIVVTFHSSGRLPEMAERVKIKKDGKESEEQTEMYIIDEYGGRLQRIPSKQDFLLKGGEKTDIKEQLNKQNEENWQRTLTHTSFNAYTGEDILQRATGKRAMEEGVEEELKRSPVFEIYKKMNTKEGQKLINSLSPPTRRFVREAISNINHADIYVQDAYIEMKTLFDQAYKAAQNEKNHEDISRLNTYREDFLKKMSRFSDKANLPELAEEVVKGIQVISTLSSTPKIFKPLNEFAIEKAADTFSGIAYKAYDEFKDKAPIISIENPPAGGGISRGEDLRELVKQARDKFVERAVKENKISEDEARKQAEKLIGVTWDVGHINMLRKYGYESKDIVKETEKIAPYLKHIHLSDNFGFEHTELPMGMGNVPIKEHEEALRKQLKEKFGDIKQIVETGGSWFRDFKVTPIAETLSAFGSPVYRTVSPYWNQARGMMGDYFSGQGRTLTDYHFSTFGAGFSQLPSELGGQQFGRSRFGGTPIE